MEATVFYRFPVTGEERDAPYAVSLRRQGDEQFAIAWTRHQRGTTATLAFLLLDLKQRAVLGEITAVPTYDLDELTLAYDAQRDCWVIVSEEGFYALLVLRTVQIGQDGRLVLSSQLWVDEDKTMSIVGPLLTLVADEAGQTLVYIKSTLPDTFFYSVWLKRVLPSSEVVHEVEVVKEEANSAVACATGQTLLLLTLAPRYGPFVPGTEERHRSTETTPHWRLALRGWNRAHETLDWIYALDIRMPVRNRESIIPYDFDWLRVGAALIPGPVAPDTGRSTFVAGAAMVDLSDNPAQAASAEQAGKGSKHVSSLCCVDEAGQLVQSCEGTVGLELQMCLSGSVVVGVDVMDGRRRLWNWVPLREQRQHEIYWLDADVRRASLVADDAADERGGDCFWLVEEYPDRVVVSKRDAFSLSEVTAVVLPDIHIPSRQKDWTPLEWDRPVEMIAYRGTLLLLGVDAQQQHLLYQVREPASS